MVTLTLAWDETRSSEPRHARRSLRLAEAEVWVASDEAIESRRGCRSKLPGTMAERPAAGQLRLPRSGAGGLAGCACGPVAVFRPLGRRAGACGASSGCESR